MIKTMLKKELRLCLHPTTPLMLALSTLTLIPNYPYGVMFFYMTLGFFFIALTGRENHDVIYSLTLPVSRRDIVRGRLALYILAELLQLLLAAGMIALHRKIHGFMPNAAGMDANLALLGEGFLYYGLFHLVFLPSYYKDVNRVGVSFVKSSAVLLALTILEIVATYAVPFVRDRLDTPDPRYLPEKAGFVLVCLVLYLLLTALAAKRAEIRFSRQDIR